jgi:AraC-like DNA-binding protein
MRRSPARGSIKQLSNVPTAQGGLSRLVARRMREAGIKLEPLLPRVGLTVDQINDPERRIGAANQIAFLEAAAEALNDNLLGYRLAETFDLRDLGLLYYVMASSGTLGEALERASRYSRQTNEAIVFQYQEAREPRLRLVYSGVRRHADLQQMEFCIAAMVRVSRTLSGRQFFPKRVSVSHVRSRGMSKLAGILGKNLEFGSEVDEITFPAGSADWTLVDADARLNRLLLKTCEEGLRSRKGGGSRFRITVENTISPLLPHGQAKANVVANKLGMSERTLVRRLAEEGLTFSEILQQLKASLAVRYLKEDGLPISRIAWLLGFEEVSSFSHACRRWTGKSPRELRQSS